MSPFALVPLWYLLVSAFVLGVVIGSFLNVFIYRFHTGKSLSGSSHCLSCQTPLAWYELFPLVSYLALRGRCRSCSAYIPSRYLWVELTTGLLFMAVVWSVAAWWLWPVYGLLMALVVVVAVYDLYHLVIPQAFVYALSGVALGMVGYAWYLQPSVSLLVYHLLGAMFLYAFFAGLWKYSAGRWIGYGDAKLAIPLGFLVGWPAAFSVLVLAFWVGTIISLTLLAWQWWQRKRGQHHLRFMAEPLTMKSEVPFAPFLLVGFLLVYIYHVDVLQIISLITPI